MQRRLPIALLAMSVFVTAASTAASAPELDNTNWSPGWTEKKRMLGKGRFFKLDDLPPSRLRHRIENLRAPARARAMQWLQERFEFPAADLQLMEADDDGAILYVDPSPLNCFGPFCPTLAESLTPEASDGADGESPEPAASAVEDAFALHSRPGAPNALFLDFDGHIFSGTAWYSGTLRAKAFDLDGSPSTFSEAERAAIAEIWHRVAEDFAPFDIDVTTEEPPSFGPTTGRVLITSKTQTNGNAMPYSSAGGVAYVGVWGRSNYASHYSPALVYYDNLAKGTTYIAETASHEFGHNLGLSHDGTSSTSYYGGHGRGYTSWAPIMGTSFYNNVTQWSKGEYADANNTQDDLAVIANQLDLVGDDHGDTRNTATALVVSTDGEILVSNPELDPYNSYPQNKGVIETRGDQDLFRFEAAAGQVDLVVNPAWDAFYRTSKRGANLDVRARLQNASGQTIASSDPTSDTYAAVSASVAASTYYLVVTGVGNGNYSDYASAGQYFISGTIPTGTATNEPPTADFGYGCMDLACSFSDSSSDSDGSILAWAWDFGDGQTSSTRNPSHTYASAGTYTVRLTVTDDDGDTDTASKTTTVSAPVADDGDELIIDNKDANTERTGTWRRSSGADPWAGESLYNDGGNVFRWLATISTEGSYQVYAWWTYHSNRSTVVPYRIAHAGGTATVTVNQRDAALGGQWIRLGEYDFALGKTYIEVSSENGQASADAVRLVKTDGGSNPPPNDIQPPTVTIDSPEANATVSGSVFIELTASDDTSIANVEIFVGDQLLTVTKSSPYQYAWDTTQHADGEVVLTALAFDAAGNEGIDEMVLTVANNASPNELIVDNQDRGTESTGTWKKSSGTNPWAGESVYSDSSSTFRWLPPIPETGRYQVFAWWTYHGNRSSNVPYRIGHDAGVDTLMIDQHDTALGGRWNLLGEYDFVAGEGYIEVSSENGQASADAVKLIKVR